MDRTPTRRADSKPEGKIWSPPFATSNILAPLAIPTGKVQRLGIGILGILLTLAIFAPLISPYAPDANVCAPFAAPTADHWLGCNDFGQDLFAQLIHGARVSLLVGMLVATFATSIATFLALLSGLNARGDGSAGMGKARVWIDRIIMRLVDVTLALPFLPLVIVLGVYFGASVKTQILVITLVMWAQPVRELRSQILTIRTASYVEASRAMGASGWFVSMRHILPDLAPLIVPQFVRIAHNAILVEAALSFLGLGDPLQNSWGTILFHANARSAVLTGTWVWWILPPGFAIALTVVAFAFIGYGFDASIGARSSHKSQLPPRKSRHARPPAPEIGLEIRNLVVSFPGQGVSLEAVDDVSLSITKGDLLGLVGASGSGKTSIALAILRLLRHPADIPSGEIWLNGEDLLQKPESAMRTARAHDIAFIPQNAMNALNPVMTIRAQLAERLRLSKSRPLDHSELAPEDWMQKVGLEPGHLDNYPHELSGGMRQRAVIAIALSNNPSLLIADEPTSGLDGLVEDGIMALLSGFREEMGLTILLVTHNLRIVARHCDRLAVLHKGRIVETGTPETLMANPANPHTRALFDNLIGLSDRPRWTAKAPSRNEALPPILVLQHVTKSFDKAHIHWPRAASGQKRTIAVKDISLTLSAGESLGLVGRSGAGKSTLARLIMGAITPDHGTITLMGKDWQTASRKERKFLRQQIHHVYQDPYQSLNNRLTIANLVAEPRLIQFGGSWRDHRDHIAKALEQVQLPSDEAFLVRSPISLSGGQRQRVAFARAIITNPALIIADEPTSMLDHSIRMEVMDIMAGLRDELGTAFVFITHDIALARTFLRPARGDERRGADRAGSNRRPDQRAQRSLHTVSHRHRPNLIASSRIGREPPRSQDRQRADILDGKVNQRPDLARQGPALQIHRAEETAVPFKVLHDRNKLAGLQGLLQREMGHIGNTTTTDGQPHDSAGRIDLKPPLYDGSLLDAIFPEHPAAQRTPVAVDDTGVMSEIIRRFRLSMGGDIVGACHQHRTRRPDLALLEGQHVRAPHAKRHINPFCRQIHIAITEPQIKRQVRVCIPEPLQHPRHIEFAKGHGSRDPDHPREPLRAFRNLGNEIIKIINKRWCPRQEILASRCQAHTAGRSLQQSHAHARLQFRDIFRGQSVGHAQLIRRRGEGTGLGRCHKGAEFVNKIHGTLIRNKM